MQLKASIYIVRHLAFQAISFRGQDESFSSSNHGNFLESLGIVTFWNEKVAEIIKKAPKVKKAIWEEIGDAKFCIMVDEARDESVKK